MDNDYYNDWLSDNIFDLRIDFCNNIEREEYLSFLDRNNLMNTAFGRREFTEGYDNFTEYCKEQFKIELKNRD